MGKVALRKSIQRLMSGKEDFRGRQCLFRSQLSLMVALGTNEIDSNLIRTGTALCCQHSECTGLLLVHWHNSPYTRANGEKPNVQ